MLQKCSTGHFSEVTSYKIHTLISISFLHTLLFGIQFIFSRTGQQRPWNIRDIYLFAISCYQCILMIRLKCNLTLSRHVSFKIQILWEGLNIWKNLSLFLNLHSTCIQVNFCQKHLFLHQLTHNMTTDCSLNYNFNTWKFQAQTWGEDVVHKHCFWHSEQFL